MDLVTLRHLVVREYNIRNTNMDRISNLYGTIDGISVPNIGDNFKYIKNLKSLVEVSFDSLTHQNYKKSEILIKKYIATYHSIDNDLKTICRVKSELASLEREINSTVGSIWSKIKSKGTLGDNKYVALENRVEGYNRSVKSNIDINYKINYLKTLVEDLKLYYNKWIKSHIETPELRIPSSISSPEVNFSVTHNFYAVRGKCYPTHASTFWKPIIEWLDYQVEKKNILKGSIFEINLEYINTESMTYMFKLLRYVEMSESRIQWFYERDDDDIIEKIQEFSEIVKCPISRIEL